MKKLIVFLDLENTLSISDHRGLMPTAERYSSIERHKKDFVKWHEDFINDAPNLPLIDILKHHQEHLKFYLISGKPIAYIDLVLTWTTKYLPFKFEKVFLRPDKDTTPTAYLKENIIESIMKKERYTISSCIFIDDAMSNRVNVNNRSEIKVFNPAQLKAIKSHIDMKITEKTEASKIELSRAEIESDFNPQIFKKSRKISNAIKNVESILNDSATFFTERREKYGDAYKKHGKIMKSFFPNGVELKTENGFLFYHLFSLIVMKLNRISVNLQKDKHPDSWQDIICFAAMGLEQMEN